MNRFAGLALLLLAACDDKVDDNTDDTTDDTTDETDSQPTYAPEVQAVLDLTGDAAAGEAIYGGNCSSCHGADGTGGIGSSLVDALAANSDWAILEPVWIQYTLDGIDGTLMGAWGDFLSDQEIADVMAYAHDTFGG